MSKNKNHQKIKEKKEMTRERAKRQEQLTNWYMINLSFGILGIVVLVLVRRLIYQNPSVLLYAQTITWSFFGVFAAAAAALFILSCVLKKANTKRLFNYGLFMSVCALVSLWLSLFNKIRPALESFVQKITHNESLMISSHWNTNLPIIGICVYLVVAFIVYVVKAAKA